MTDPVHVIGASGRSGVALCRSLLADGIPVVPVVRNVAKWAQADVPGTPVTADLQKLPFLKAALVGASRIVSCAHARHAPTLIAAAPETALLVLLGSTRKFTHWPDAHGNGVLAGETALITSGRRGVILHPSMIYGAQGEDNVQRLAALLRRVPIVPLPGGGRFRVQPIHQSDVTRCIRAALDCNWNGPHALTIAGPEPVAYADFVRAIAAATGLRQPIVLSFPAAPLIFASVLTRHVRILPSIQPEEIRRLMEDKVFDIGPMRTTLSVEPIPLSKGLALTFAPPQDS